jgi:uncharacterized membrane protein
MSSQPASEARNGEYALNSSTNSGDSAMILTHYYRAMIGRADTWRIRMDTTTNWAIGATAAIVSFALGDVSSPHYVMFIASLLTLCFLTLEARRLTFYHLFQQRALRIERYFIEPSLLDNPDSPAIAELRSNLREALRGHLGRTAPTMPLIKAIARRLRRIYLYLFAVQLLAWLLKLSNHPNESLSVTELVRRAHVGFIPGAVVVSAVAASAVIYITIAISKGGTDASSQTLD